MLYLLFKKIYLSSKPAIERENRKRLAEELLPPEVKIETYSYIPDCDAMHCMNIYRAPNGSSELPVVIDIHGGGWLCGDKDTNGNFNCHLALDCCNVTSLSYRTVDCGCTLVEQIQDIFAYWHFLYDNQAELKLNMDLVALAGDSAGAQLALLAYRVNMDKQLQRIFSVFPVKMNVRCLILNHGVCYLDRAGALTGHPLISRVLSIPGLQQMLYGKNFETKESYLHSVVPGRYIHKASDLPPVMLITSSGDSAYNYQTIDLYNALKVIGADCHLYVEENSNAEHVFNIANPDGAEGRKCNNRILQFIAEHCVNSGGTVVGR